MADVEINVSDNIAASITTKLKGIGQAARSSYTDVQKLQNALNGLGSNTNALKTAAANLNTLRQGFLNANGAATILRTNVTALNTGLSTGARSAAAMQRGLAGAGQQATRTNTTFGQLSNTTRQLVGLFVAGFGIRAFLQAADAATTVSNKVRIVSTDLEEFNANQEAVYKIAIQNRVAVTDVATAFQRYSVALKGITNTAGVLDFIDLLSKALVTNGATTSEVDAAITQLSQAFQKGKLDGDEFRTVMETLPALSSALTTALGKTKQELFALSKQGKITPDVILQAFKGSAQGIRDAFASTLPTIQQSLVVLQDQFAKFMSGNSAASQLLAKTILFIGDNLNFIIPLIVAFGAAWAAVQLRALYLDLVLLVTEGLIPMGAALLGALPAIGAFALASLDFSLILAAAASAVFLLALGLAKLTGNEQGFLDWMNSAIEKVGDFVVGAIDSVQHTAQFGTSLGSLTQAANVATASTGAAAKSLKSIGTSAQQAAKDTNSATASMAAGVHQLSNTLDNLIWKMNQVANAASHLAQYNDLISKGGSEGSFTAVPGIDKTGTPDFQTIPRPTTFPSFAGGGSIMVGGKGGVDQNIVSFNASRGERVDISTPAQQRRAAGGRGAMNFGGPRNVSVTIVTPDAASFSRSRKQIGQQMKAIMG